MNDLVQLFVRTFGMIVESDRSYLVGLSCLMEHTCVQSGGKQVVRGSDSVNIARKVEVELNRRATQISAQFFRFTGERIPRPSE